MTEVLIPATTSSEGLNESAPDSTAPAGLVFFHASEGKPLATPWQVALIRSQLLARAALPEGIVLDCACGSGIQLAAHASVLQRPALGVELNPNRAKASAVNLNTIALQRQEIASMDAFHPRCDRRRQGWRRNHERSDGLPRRHPSS